MSHINKGISKPAPAASAASSFQKESILELAKMIDTVVRVKCLGGRELQGVLRGYDDLVNLVLDNCVEYVRGNSVDR
jgi:small nuclear ribonucleoprotein (snRNP)-like protein